MRNLSSAFPYPRRIDLRFNVPPRLEAYAGRAESLDAVGDALDARLVVAIVGAREAESASLDYAYALAKSLAAKGAVVASGGAKGIDRAAHEGAMAGGGRTWSVIPAGYPIATPPDHCDLYERIVHGGGTLLWTLDRNVFPHLAAFRQRNRLLVTIADVVVVVQASFSSGSLNTATIARKMQRSLWVVPPAPWFPADKFAGNVVELERTPTPNQSRARPLMNDDTFFKALGLADSVPVAETPRDDAAEVAILRALRDAHDNGAPAVHTDEIAMRSELSPQQVSTALLTLSLEALVLEGPGGFYRRQAVPRPVMNKATLR